jgi:hypothetical protein
LYEFHIVTRFLSLAELFSRAMAVDVFIVATLQLLLIT